MANLYPKHTGLPVVIWVDNVGSDRHLEHNLPRVKVQNVRGGANGLMMYSQRLFLGIPKY